MKKPNDKASTHCIRVAAPDGTETDLCYTVRRSDRARRMRLRVHTDGRVEVVLPRRAPTPPVEDFVRRSVPWIQKTQTRFADRVPSMPAITADETWFEGRRVPVVHRPGSAPPFRIRWIGDRFEITGDGSRLHAVELLEAWFRRVARATIEQRVHALNAETAYVWQRIRIADQATRWGSCSTRGTLSFNWRLLMAPPEVLDYVVIHELAHLEEMNHSPRFWALVAARCPDYKRHMQWLKDHGATLK